MAFCFLSQLNQNAGYEVEDEDRSSPVDEEGENKESDIELDPEDARARGNGNRANVNLDLDLDSETEEGAGALNQTINLLGRQNFMTLKLRCSTNTQAHNFFYICLIACKLNAIHKNPLEN